MIFKRRKHEAVPEAVELDERTETGEADQDSEPEAVDPEAALAALDDEEWRADGPWDITEVDDLDNTDDGPRIDLGAMILTGVPGSELRLQIAEETQQVVSAMLVMEITLEAPADAASGGAPRVQTVSSALELGAYAAPRSGGLWSELRAEISEHTLSEGGSASLDEGPFGVELRRLVPVRTPDGEEGYQPSRMWVAEGPRWLLRGIVYGQAAIDDDPDSPVVDMVASAFRQVVVRRGDEPMAPGDLLPLQMPTDLVSDETAN